MERTELRVRISQMALATPNVTQSVALRHNLSPLEVARTLANQGQVDLAAEYLNNAPDATDADLAEVMSDAFVNRATNWSRLANLAARQGKLDMVEGVLGKARRDLLAAEEFKALAD